VLKKIFDSIYAVSDTRTLYIDGINVLVLADAHLGFEEDMARSGFFIPRAQLLKAINYVEKALGYIGEVSRVVIDGDLKHAFDRLLRQEKLEVKQFLDYLTKERRVKEVVVVRGNHDNFLPIVLKEYGVNLVDSIEYSVAGLKILLTHGHKELDLSHDAVIIGHEHPSINLVDSLGLLIKVPCYLKMPTDTEATILVLPAIGAYQAGNSISLVRENYLSPIVRKYAVIEDGVPIAILDDQLIELPEAKFILRSLSTHVH